MSLAARAMGGASFGMGTSESYAEGFMKAIERIVMTLHTTDGAGHPDQLFYPIAYLARHHFELMMKHLIIQASILVPPTVTAADLSHTHSLVSLWNKLRPMLEKLWPGGPQEELDAVESVLQEFHRLDPAGMAFRYDSDQKGQKYVGSLPDIVDLESLWLAVRDVAALFQGCSAAIQDMLESLEQ